MDAKVVKDLLAQATKLVADAISGNSVSALPDALRLLALVEAEIVPPIDASSLDPVERAEVDAEVDAEVAKP